MSHGRNYNMLLGRIQNIRNPEKQIREFQNK